MLASTLCNYKSLQHEKRSSPKKVDNFYASVGSGLHMCIYSCQPPLNLCLEHSGTLSARDHHDKIVFVSLYRPHNEEMFSREEPYEMPKL